MGRDVFGSIPMIVSDIGGVSWKRIYSFWQLGEATGESGGADFFLMATFLLFCCIGPVLRAVLLLLDLVLPWNR